jgi:nucleoside-diphosphate-sugar epimerase
MKTVLVTGAAGFVGTSLCQHLLRGGWAVRGTLLVSKDPASLVEGVEPVVIESLGPDTEWANALHDVDIIIHLAARVHIMNERALNPLEEFRKVNVAGTERLANEAVKAGVKRLVFVSSIKVSGDESPFPYTPESPVKPTDPYGISKWEAETKLRRIEAKTGLEVVVVRPTLVYGPGVKANFLNLIKCVEKGIPFPFASVKNLRSLIYVGNLVHVLALCSVHSVAAGKTYLVSDGEDVSTPELYRRLAMALQVPVRLFSIPRMLLRAMGAITGKSSSVRRLMGSLTVDSSKIRRELGWTPPFSMEEGIRATVEWYAKAKGSF